MTYLKQLKNTIIKQRNLERYIMMSKIVSFKQYKKRVEDEEKRTSNIIRFLQIKLLEELYYRTDIEIEKLFKRFEELPGINCILNHVGKNNIDKYFNEFYIESLFNEVIMSDRNDKENDKEIDDVIYEIRSEMLDNLIVKYLPSKLSLVGDSKFNRIFFKECSTSNLFSFKREILHSYFDFRNRLINYKKNGARYVKNDDTREEGELEVKNIEIKDEDLGVFKFVKEDKMYICDYCGEFNNFTIKIVFNNEEEVHKSILELKDMVNNIDLVNSYINKDFNEFLDKKRKSYWNREENTADNQDDDINSYEDVLSVINDRSYLFSIQMWPDRHIEIGCAKVFGDGEDLEMGLGVILYDSINNLLKEVRAEFKDSYNEDCE